MSSFLCFICHSTVTSDTNEEMRERYREVVGMYLCPDSHLCYICCYVLNKLWLFRAVCLKRSLEYPVLFSEKGTINLQRNDLEIHTICPEDICAQYHNRNINAKIYHFHHDTGQNEYNFDNNCYSHNEYNISFENQYHALEDSEFDEYFQNYGLKNHFQNDVVNTFQNNDMRTCFQMDTVKNCFENDGMKIYSFENDDIRNINNFAHDNIKRDLQNISCCQNESIKSDFQNVTLNTNYQNEPKSNFDKNDKACEFENESNINYENFIPKTSLELNIENKIKIFITDYNDQGNQTDFNEKTTETDNKIEALNVNLKITDQNTEFKQQDDEINDFVNSPEKESDNDNSECEQNAFEDKNDSFDENDEINQTECDEFTNDDINYEEEEDVQIKTETHIQIEDSKLNENKIDTLEMSEEIQKGKVKKRKKKFEKIALTVEEQKADLERRRKEKKYIEAEFKCHNCAQGFLFKDTYQTHMMRHEESNGEYRCPVCTLRFAHPSVLRAHSALHGERYHCLRCDDVIAPGQRRGHARNCWGRGEGGACHLCGGVFQDPNGLQQHLKRFHKTTASNKTYPCNVCGKTYYNQAAVRTHMIKHINKKFDCDKCPSTFSSPYTLKQHKKKHEVTDPTLHYCVSCNISFNSRKSLLAHRRNALAHTQTVFECPICSRVSPTQRALTAHVEAVHYGRKGKPVNRSAPKIELCHLCGANFKGKNKLNRHLRQVCEKAKLEEEFANLYEQECLNDT